MITFKTDMPVGNTMAFEKLFAESLALSTSDKRDVLKECEIKLWMFVDGELAGETYGMALTECKEEIPGCEAYQRSDCLYVYSIAVLKPFQGKGLSKILKAYSLGMAFGKGFESVIDHAADGASIHLNKLFGATIVGEYPNWYETGKTYYLNEITRP